MLRIIAIIFLGVVAVGLGWLVVNQIRANEDSRQIAYLVRYWTNKVDRDIRPGESREEVAQWIAEQFPEQRGQDHFEDFDRRFFVTANSVKVTAFPYPCTMYAIRLEIYLGPDDRVKRRDVTTSGVCV
jgi:hypothetical protein